MLYNSTRGDEGIKSTEALVNGIANDGGLYVPISFPQLKLEDMQNKDFQEIALTIFKHYFDINKEYLESAIKNAYGSFNVQNVCPLKSTSSLHYLELFHGNTLAFKDVALSMLPYLITEAAKIENLKENICILTATSGDTGSAAISGFANVPNVKICILFPTKGISQIQKLQMTTVDAPNVAAFAIQGNFDDAQRTVKTLFQDSIMNETVLNLNYRLSSANSINIGRLVPQIIYYFTSYMDLVQKNTIQLGNPIDVCVPTGNFGNIMAAYFAKEMGLPVEKFIVASNDNNILTDFFSTGIYDTNRDFKITTSPSMDILISSNLERLIYLKTDVETTKEKMEELKGTGKFELPASLFDEFRAGYANETDVLQEIKNVFEKDGYLIDPHTAVASIVARKQTSTNEIIIAGTASPFKFPKVICEALEIDTTGLDEFGMIEQICQQTSTACPEIIEQLQSKEELHNSILHIDEVQKNILDFIE